MSALGSDFPLLIKTLLHTPLQRRPHVQIISDGITSYDYRTFDQRLRQLGDALTNFGVNQGDVVAVMDWDTHRYLECFFTIPMLGAVLHTINVRLSPAQIAYTINHAKDDVILVHSDFMPLLADVMPMVDRPVKIIAMTDAIEDDVPATELAIDGHFETLLQAGDAAFAFPDFDENIRATTFYTTGTTGDPKAVAYTHRQLVLHTMATVGAFGSVEASNRLHDGDVYMPITPMFHVHGWGFPYAATLLGIKQIYPGRYIPARLLHLIDAHRVTFSHCVPTILQMLLAAPEATATKFEGWKVVIGGSALPHGLASAALDRGINVFAAYGLSETCPVLTFSHLDPAKEDDVAARLKTGLPAPMVELRVVDANMRDVPRDGVSTGEIVARAPWLNAAYLGNDAATAELWRGGYLHTGDVGYLDDTGALIITDRMKDVIKSGGEWISSLALESIASAVAGVGEVAAIGIADEQWGERPMLLVVLAPAADGDSVWAGIMAAFAASVADGTLSKWAAPQRVDFVAEIAKTSVGKIDKKRLRLAVE